MEELAGFIKPNKVNMVIDGQFGSTGKGAIAAKIALDNFIHLACSTTSPNAGHTFYFNNEKYITHLIPAAGIIHDRCAIYFSSEAVINVQLLLSEMEEFNIDPSRVWIHPRAAIIEQSDIDKEKTIGGIETIASTQSGVGSARASKILRTNTLAIGNKVLNELELVRKYPIKEHLKEIEDFSVMVETGQGLDLDINHGLSYPYCTSRSVMPATILGELGLHPRYIGNVMLSFRTFPIRVGNPIREGKEVGYSGPFYDDSTEIEFSDIQVADEYTTVTKRKRRIATFSMEQYKRSIDLIEPTHIFLNFINYLTNYKEKLIFPKGYKPTHVGYGPYCESITKYSKQVLDAVYKL